MGFLERLGNAWKIFVLSFQLLGKDKSLAIIPLFMLLSTYIVLILFSIIFGFPLYTGFFSSYFARAGVFGQSYGIVFVLLFLFLQYFWIYFLAAAQCWMVYEALYGKDTTVISGIKRAFRNLGDILIFSLVMMLLTGTGSGRNKNAFARLFGPVISYFATLAGRLVLPGMIVTEKSFLESVKELKNAPRAWVEIAVYEIGTGPLWMIFFIILLVMTMWIGSLFGGSAYGLTLIAGLMILISVATYVNTTYYTLLYLALIERKQVPGLEKLSFAPVFGR